MGILYVVDPDNLRPGEVVRKLMDLAAAGGVLVTKGLACGDDEIAIKTKRRLMDSDDR